MALENFKPILWSTGVLEQFPKAQRFAGLANMSYQGVIDGYGSSVKINQIGRAEAVEYTGASAITYPELDDASLTLTIDQRYVVPATIADFDNAQTEPKLFNAYTREIAYAASDKIDQSIAALYTSAGNTIGSTVSPESVTSANVVDYINQIHVALDEDNVPMESRVAVVPPWFIGKIRLAKIDSETNNDAIISEGFVGRFLGIDFYNSNNVTKSGTTWYAPMFFRAGDTYALAQQLGGAGGADIEILRDKDYLNTYMRLPMLWGVKMIRPESMVVLYCASGAES